MRKYLYLIKKQKIKSWLKFWLLTRDKVNYILSEILEGTSFNLQNTVKRYFKIFNIFGNSVQDGTPTPSNPVPIESVADDVNLFDISKIETIGAITNNGDNTITITNSYSTSTAKKLSALAPELKIGETYILNLETTGTNKFIYLYGSNEKWNVGTTKTITQSDLDSYVFVYGENNKAVTISDIKIAKGTTLTPYSPYNYGTSTIDFEGQTENYNYTFITKPLRSLPNGVRDSLEDDGIHRRVGRIVLDGTETFSVNSNWNYENTNLFILSNKITTTKEVVSNYFKYYKNVYGNDIDGEVGQVWTDRLAFRISNTIANSKSEFQTWLSTHNTEVLYELAEVVIEPYTEEQQEQYNKIKELYTFDGITNISSDDEVPPYLQIQYYMKGE